MPRIPDLTDEELLATLDEICEDKGYDHCHVCGSEELGLIPHLTPLRAPTIMQVFPVVSLVCDSCGAVQLFSIKGLKSLAHLDWQESDEAPEESEFP